MNPCLSNKNLLQITFYGDVLCFCAAPSHFCRLCGVRVSCAPVSPGVVDLFRSWCCSDAAPLSVFVRLCQALQTYELQDTCYPDTLYSKYIIVYIIQNIYTIYMFFGLFYIALLYVLYDIITLLWISDVIKDVWCYVAFVLYYIKLVMFCRFWIELIAREIWISACFLLSCAYRNWYKLNFTNVLRHH